MKSALFFLLTCALTLGACSDRDPVSSNQPTAAAAKRVLSSVTWTRTPAAGRAESRLHPLGLVEVRAGESVQIRSLLAHTIAPSVGTTERYAIELAIRDIGSIHGYKIELGEPADGACGPTAGRDRAEQISADPQVIGVIGTSCSGSAVAASPVFSAAGLAMISPSNTSPRLTSDLAGNAGPDYHPGYFRVSSNDLYKGQAVADFAYSELGLRRVATVDDGDPYTTALVSAFGDAFRKLGGQVAVVLQIQKGDTDMTAVLAEIAAAGPDGIFFPLFEIEGVPFTQQVRAFAGLADATLIVGESLLVPGFISQPHSEGMYFTGPEIDHGANVNAVTGQSADEVLAAYTATYGAAPTSTFWAHAYDATTLLLHAIEAVAVAEDGKLLIDRAALRQQLSATAGFQGLLGPLSCDDFGDCGTGRVNIYHRPDASITEVAQLPVVHRFAP